MLSPLLGVYKRCDIAFKNGKGCYLIDQNGKKYIDLGSGVAVMSLGYNHPKLIKALKKAAKLPWHVSNIYQIEGQTELASKLVNNTNLDSAFFCNSGAEAVETAIKIVRKYFNSTNPKNKKTEIITFEHGFHGRTMAAISASGCKKYQEGYEPLVEKFVNIPLKNLDIKKVAKKVTSKTAAIMIEPIQGEGGVNVFPLSFLKELQQLCSEKEIILIFDEVQCGIGRTGQLFHYLWDDINPDIVCTAKGIGGGFPLAGCLVKDKYAKVMTPGSHGGTYGGNPLSMAIGNAVIDEVLKPSFLANVITQGEYFKEKLEILQKKFPNIIEEVKGTGLILGLKISGDYMAIVNQLRNNGVLTIPASNNVIRILPPLIIKKKDIDFALKLINEVFTNIESV